MVIVLSVLAIASCASCRAGSTISLISVAEAHGRAHDLLGGYLLGILRHLVTAMGAAHALENAGVDERLEQGLKMTRRELVALRQRLRRNRPRGRVHRDFGHRGDRQNGTLGDHIHSSKPIVVIRRTQTLGGVDRHGRDAGH
jgi:hypothetical protein